MRDRARELSRRYVTEGIERDDPARLEPCGVRADLRDGSRERIVGDMFGRQGIARNAPMAR